MNKLFLLLALPTLLLLGCKKEKFSYNETFKINFKVDGKAYSVIYPEGKLNYGTGYDWEVETGKYKFGRGAGFDISSKSFISFQLAAASGQLIADRAGAFESLKSLYAVGEKKYDSISFSASGDRTGVEVTFQEEDGTLWYSTKLIFFDQHHVEKVLDQPGSSFRITEIRQVNAENNDPYSLIVKGTFNCILYEFNGDRRKQVTEGSFTVLIGL